MGRTVQVWEQAARAYGIEPTPRPRPGLARWLLYVVWVPLPERYRVWVLFDATCRTWVLRHLFRVALLTAVPTIALALLLPGPVGLRLLIALTTGGVSFALTAVWINESTEHRLVDADWPWQLGPTLRELRADIAEGRAP